MIKSCTAPYSWHNTNNKPNPILTHNITDIRAVDLWAATFCAFNSNVYVIRRMHEPKKNDSWHILDSEEQEFKTQVNDYIYNLKLIVKESYTKGYTLKDTTNKVTTILIKNPKYDLSQYLLGQGTFALATTQGKLYMSFPAFALKPQ